MQVRMLTNADSLLSAKTHFRALGVPFDCCLVDSTARHLRQLYSICIAAPLKIARRRVQTNSTAHALVNITLVNITLVRLVQSFVIILTLCTN